MSDDAPGWVRKGWKEVKEVSLTGFTGREGILLACLVRDGQEGSSNQSWFGAARPCVRQCFFFSFHQLSQLTLDCDVIRERDRPPDLW